MPNQEDLVLSPGDRICVLPFSHGMHDFKERAVQGIELLQSLGYEIVCSPHAWQSGLVSLEERVADFAWALNANCRGVLAVSSDTESRRFGDCRSTALLLSLDYRRIKDQQLVVIGHAAHGALLNAICARTGLPTIMGPSLLDNIADTSLDEGFTLFALDDMLRNGSGLIPSALTDRRDDWLDRNNNPANLLGQTARRWFLRDGQGEGMLVGGTLLQIVGLLGSRYFPAADKYILVWDVAYVRPSEIDVAMSRLALTGFLDRVRGMLIGRPYRANATELALPFTDLILEHVSRTRFPILVDVEIGHTAPVASFPIGRVARISSTGSDDLEVF